MAVAPGRCRKTNLAVFFFVFFLCPFPPLWNLLTHLCLIPEKLRGFLYEWDNAGLILHPEKCDIFIIQSFSQHRGV